MTEIQNSKPVLVIGYWNLRFICNLVLGFWDFGLWLRKIEVKETLYGGGADH
jgi:hypothetical protein